MRRSKFSTRFVRPPDLRRPFAQITTAAIDLGIARAAQDRSRSCTHMRAVDRQRQRERGSVDGRADWRHRVPRARGRRCSRARGASSTRRSASRAETVAQAAIAVGEAKIATTRCRCSRRASCSSSAAASRRSRNTTSTATGATRACIRCTTRCAGSITRSVTTTSTA